MRQLFLAIVTIVIAFATSPAHAQKQYNVWYFGGGAGIDFNTTPPSATRSPFTGVLEGLATIADPYTGEILFSTDGTTVLDRNGVQMPNGFGLLGGEGTSTQGAMILPFPLDEDRYYIITADQAGYMSPNVGVHYSIVDMRLNEGLGDITQKNILLFGPPMAEKLTAIRHENGCDAWILTHSGSTNEYKAALLQDSVILQPKVISSVGIAPADHPSLYYENIGELISSPDGRKIAYLASNGFLEIADFNPATGQVTNVQRLASNSDGFYGACFSPDGSKLYVASYEPLNIRQYDLSLAPNQIPNSSRFVSTNSGRNIKLGPDGNLYAFNASQNAMTVIREPNQRYPNCEVSESEIPFESGTSSAYGMPNLAASFMGDFRPCVMPTVNLQANYGTVCAGDCIDFSALAANNVPIEWAISDGRVIRGERTTSICFDSAGTYTVELRGFNLRGDTVKAYRTLRILPALNFKLRPFSVVTDTIGAVIKVPIILNDTISSVFEGQFSFDPNRLEYVGAFDEEGNRIDIGSVVDQGEIRITEWVDRDSIVGYMFFNLYWEDTLCRSIQLVNSRLTSASVQCLLNDAQYEMCLDAACGTQMISHYLRTSKISASIVPNPAVTSIELRTTHDVNDATITLIDMNGREVLRTMSSFKAETPASLDVSELAEGIYFLTIQSATAAGRETVVIKR